MKNLTKHLLYKGTGIGRQNVAWNIAGSFVYTLTSMVLFFLIIWVMGDDQGGTFSPGSSILGRQIFIVAYFGIRPSQITGGAGEYSFGDRLEHRNITCIMALGTGIVFLAFMYDMGRYTADKCMILILPIIHKVIDGCAGVYESGFQRQGNLHLTGRSNFFQALFSVSVFLVTLAASEHFLSSCLAAVAAQAVGIVLLNLDVIHALPSMDWNKGERKTGRLFKNTSFLFISAFLGFYVFSIAKYVIDARLNNAASGYLNLIFTPTSIIYMVANFAIKPFLTRSTDLWTGKDYDYSRKELRCIGTIILELTVPVVGTTAVLGKWAPSVMGMVLGSGYEGRLVDYYGTFIIIALGGGFYALANPMCYTLAIMCKQKAIFTVYLAAAATAAVLSGFLVSEFGTNGTAGCYLLLMMGSVTDFGLHTVGVCQSEKKENTGSGGGNT